ncbi:MAG: hypothetical protein GWO28_01220 [candidate division Zixibacteria bacterium]|nr:hypothetical protein [candidate division Zixibacteria bacterium]
MATTKKKISLLELTIQIRMGDYSSFKDDVSERIIGSLQQVHFLELVDGSYYYGGHLYEKVGIGVYINTAPVGSEYRVLLEADEILANFDHFKEIGRFISPCKATLSKMPIRSIGVVSKGYSFYCAIDEERGYPGAVLLSSPSLSLRNPSTGKRYTTWDTFGNTKEEVEEMSTQVYCVVWHIIKQALAADVALLSTPSNYSWNKFLKANKDWHVSQYILNGNSDNLIALGMAEIGR